MAKERRPCAGRMFCGTPRSRPCWWSGVVKYKGKWYCRKCCRILIRKDPKKHGLIPPKDIKKLYKDVRRYQAKGGAAPFSAPVLLNEVLPRLLIEIAQLRGIKLEEPEELG